MKKFRQWIAEDGGPANSIGGGDAIRGLGNVTGVPGGDISNYAAANAAEAARLAPLNKVDTVLSYSGGDTEDQVMKLGRRRKR
jgi:hypothetical protein